LNLGFTNIFNRDKERLSDEKQVERLFKDITNGTLRRKRGADYDLSDSDDDGEARRRMKRKEFAKMRKALLEDERIGKIAENPKRLAFLRAIEDRGDNDDVDFLADFDDSQSTSDSQSQSQTGQQDVIQVNSSQPTATMGPPKRKLGSDTATENRLPPHLRRTKAGKKPSNLSEIRESLSSLIEEPNAMVQSHDFSDSESDLEIEGDMRNAQKEKENRDPFAPRRRKSHPVVDRISLKRASSSSVSTSVKLAFAASTVASAFKVPALLRRATTNSSITSGSGSSVSGTERMSGAFGDDGKTAAKKATKSSGVNYFARENERRVALKEGEKRREQKRFKGAEGRRKAVGGLFGNGKFE
jgi:mediator of replication checkpoint protein 1